MRELLQAAYGKLAFSTVKGNTLTVVMFHRVLPAEEIRQRGAMPEWTLTPELFSACLAFFDQHFSVVDLDSVLRAAAGEERMPKRSLLITFDDGWRDVLEFACPLLKARGLPAVCFIVTRASAGKGMFWAEAVHKAIVLGDLPSSIRKVLIGTDNNDELGGGFELRCELARTCITRLKEYNEETRIKVIGNWLNKWECLLAKEFLRESEWHRLGHFDMAVGSHGLSHVPLDETDDYVVELLESAKMLSSALPKASINSFSFPHGRYTKGIVEKLASGPYKLLFTSDAVLNSLKTLSGCPKLIGRVSLTSQVMSTDGYRLNSAKLFSWLNRDVASIDLRMTSKRMLFR